MAETGALGVFFEGLLKSMQETHELGAQGKFATEAVAVVWLDVDSSFPVSFVSRFQGFCCSLGMKDSLPHCSVENWRKIHRLESVYLSKATDSLFPATKSHLVPKKHIAKPFVSSFAC